MATAEDVLRKAYGELGYYPPADPEPGSKYGRWLAQVTGEDWLAGPSTSIWWCMMYVSWCFDGIQYVPGLPTYNTDLFLNGGGRTQEISPYETQPGDIVIFDWNWDSDTDHVGIATSDFDGNGFSTIEGNVGNQVVEKYRTLSNVAAVVRPRWEGSGPTPSPDEPIECDGWAGGLTIRKWQSQMGSPYCDGLISGQARFQRGHYPGILDRVIIFDGGTGESWLIREVQRRVGAEPDGVLGPDSCTRIQQTLQGWGYDIGPDGADSYLGNRSIAALQQSLNDGRWR